MSGIQTNNGAEYSRPALTVYGSVKNLTGGSTSKTNDKNGIGGKN